MNVTEEFRDYVQDDALSIEVWGHRSSGFGSDSLKGPLAITTQNEQQYKTLQVAITALDFVFI